MDLVSGRNRRLESAISIFLLVVLFLIGLGVFVKQFDADMGRFGIYTTAAGLSPQQIEAKTQGPALDIMMPGGFKKLSEIETYDAGNLYEKINGKAPLYIEAGFEKLFTRRFISKDDESLWIEVFVYDMAAVRNAFSVYSVQRRADVFMTEIPDPRFSYRTGNALYFINGQYYIELIGSAKSDRLFKAMVEIARDIEGKLAVDKVTDIAELSLFPPENIVAGSARLYLANAFGFEAFTDIFTCLYKLGDESITAFFSKRPNPQDAQEIAERYYNFLIDNDAGAKPTASRTLKGIGAKVLDFYGTTEIVFAAGPFVGGIHEAENQQAAEEIAVRLLEKLGEAAKTIE